MVLFEQRARFLRNLPALAVEERIVAVCMDISVHTHYDVNDRFYD